MDKEALFLKSRCTNCGCENFEDLAGAGNNPINIIYQVKTNYLIPPEGIDLYAYKCTECGHVSFFKATH